MKKSHILLCLLLAGGLSPAQDQPPSGAPTPAEGETIVPPSEQISEAATRRELARLRQRQRKRAIGKPGIGKPSTQELVDRRIGQAETLAGDHRYEEAIQALTQLRAEYPGDPKVMLALARVLSWSQRFKESIQTYGELARLTPGDPTVWKEMARVAIWNKQMSLARESYAKIYTPSVDEKLAETLRLSGHDQVMAGGIGGAQAKGKAPYEQYERVRQLLDSGQLPPGSRPSVEAALSDLQSDYRIQKAAWLESSARWHEWNGRLIHAEETYQELVAFQPDKPDDEQALFDLAGVQTSQDLTRASTATYQQLLQLDPSNKIAAQALELQQIRQHPGIFAEYNYFDEHGTGRNADIAIQRFQSGAQFFWNAQTRIRFSGNYWFVEPGIGPHADAAGPTIGISTVFNEFWRASAEWTNKQYFDAPFSATNTARADVTFNAWDYVHLGLQYARLDVLDNNFALQQGVQSDNVSLFFSSDVNHNIAVSGNATWIHYTDNNQGVWLYVEPKFLLLDRPEQTLKLTLRGEYRNTKDLSFDQFQGPRLVNIIHPYWTPQDYGRGTVAVEWRQDLSPILFAGAEQHYFALRLGGGFDSTGNKNVFVEGAWHYDFLKHWTLEARGTVDRSPAWDGAFATLSVLYRF